MDGVNPKTGLRESVHEKFKIPVVQQLDLDHINFEDYPLAIHSVPVREVPSLDFYAKLAPSEELYVSLQGAVTPGKLRYPSLWRITSMRNRVPAFMAIADPTLQLSDNEDFGLAWYTGGPEWDPLPQIARVVQQAMESVGATRVMFLGGSGGGFASLRIATLFPGSMAFAQDPQTSVAAYNPVHQNRMVDACWQGLEREEVIARHPERFDLGYLYRETAPENMIYYRQSTSDRHLEQHCKPFMEAVRGTAGDVDGRFKFVLEKGERDGHGAITDEEFDRHFLAAQRHWGVRD